MKPASFALLAVGFDAAPLLAEAEAIPAARWTAHFNQGDHDGGWSGVALRSPGGDAARLYAGPNTGETRDTELMAQCPSIAAALLRIECPLRAVRLLKLAPGAVIREHSDPDLLFEQGEARLHIPLVTSDAVEFYVDDRRVIMEAGECWYLDLSRPHRVHNRGTIDRIHLVVDCAVNEWLATMIANAKPLERRAAQPSGQEAFALFRERVLEDAGLQEMLCAIEDANAFIERTVALGAVQGFDFAADEVRSAMTRGKRSWLSQWIV